MLDSSTTVSSGTLENIGGDASAPLAVRVAVAFAAAAVLEAEFGILGRAGIHCAPRAHGAFGTRESGGAMRLSLGAFNTPDHIDAALDALRAVCRELGAGVAANAGV